MTVALRFCLSIVRTVRQQIAAIRRRVRIPAWKVAVPDWARPWLWVAKRVACVGLIAVAAVTLGIKIRHDRQITRHVTESAFVRQGVTMTDQWQCIYREIRAAVPEGSRVDVTYPANLAYFSRMVELSTGWAVPVAKPSDAQWRLFIYRTHGYCSGLAVAVQRP
jgi:hypothetical protein